MHKTFITLMLIVAATVTALAQQPGVDLEGQSLKPIHFSLYAEAGGAYTTYHSTDKAIDPTFGSVIGPNAGVGVNMRFLRRDPSDPAMNGWLALQAGVHYDRTGFKADGTKFTLDNLCIPVELQFYPIRDLYVCAGPEFCINLGLKPKAASVMGMDIALDGHKANDLRLGFGAGYMLPSIPLGLNVKYLIGTSKFSDNLPWKGNQVRVSLFYRFGL